MPRVDNLMEVAEAVKPSWFAKLATQTHYEEVLSFSKNILVSQRTQV